MGVGKEIKGLKNVKFIFFVLISIIFIFPTLTSAESITNNNGIVITEEEYNNFLKIYSSDYIMHMTEEKYNQLKEFDFNNIVTETKYVEVMYNQSLNNNSFALLLLYLLTTVLTEFRLFPLQFQNLKTICHCHYILLIPLCNL